VQTSLHILMAAVYFFRENLALPPGVTGRPLKDVFLDLGLKAKAIYPERLADATFLRGWWTTEVWVPLPSALLKLGKTLKSPNLIAQTKDRLLALKRTAWALSQSYKNIPPDYPLLGPFLAMLKRLGSSSSLTPNAIIESFDYKAKGGVFTVKEETLAAIKRRYQFTTAELESAALLMKSVHTLPVMISHPCFERLLAVDY